jgi:hypothetical protein
MVTPRCHSRVGGNPEGILILWHASRVTGSPLSRDDQGVSSYLMCTFKGVRI